MVLVSSADCAAADLRRRDLLAQAAEGRRAAVGPAGQGGRAPVGARWALGAWLARAGERIGGVPRPAVADVVPRPASAK